MTNIVIPAKTPKRYLKSALPSFCASIACVQARQSRWRTLSDGLSVAMVRSSEMGQFGDLTEGMVRAIAGR